MRRMFLLEANNQEKEEASEFICFKSIKRLPFHIWFLIIGIGCLAIGFYMGYEYGTASGINSVMTYFQANPQQCFGLV